MLAECRHTVIAETELKLIEVQIGKDISVEDKQKFDLEIQKDMKANIFEFFKCRR